MCGIAGIIALDGRPVDEGCLRSMVRAVAHRGPDGEGILVRGPVGLGHRRLAIVDLSDAGLQPMASGDGTLAVTYNGEIYNYVELREELSALGHRFRSASDTEVLLASYREWGPRCVDRFNGMWAFAIHDAVRRTVFCSRDRFGVKPFLFARRPGLIAFGSEPAQLLPLLAGARADREVLRDFLFMGIDEPVGRSFFEGIEKLPGGHSLTVDLDSGTAQIRREYSIAHRPDVAAMPAEEAVAEYGRCLREAVAIRLRSDVPVGTCLSGGLDSSSVAALAANGYRDASGSRFRAITAVSEEATNDETPFAKAVAQWCGLDWTTVRPSYEDFAATLPDVVRTQGEPFGGPSICMQWFVMRTAREHGIPVLLDGQGGDETLLGYPIYRGMYLRWLLRNRGVLPALAGFMRFRRSGAVSGAELLRYMVGAESASSRFKAYLWKHRYLHVDFAMPEIIRARSEASSDFFELHRLEIFRTILPSLLRYEDRNSMAWSVESRLPFLDYRLVELSCSIPAEQKLHGGWSKYVLRRFAERVVPHEVAWRKSKFGFEAPDADWLRPLLPRMREAVVASPMLAQLAESSQLGPGFDGLDLRSQWRLFVCSKWEAQHGISGISG